MPRERSNSHNDLLDVSKSETEHRRRKSAGHVPHKIKIATPLSRSTEILVSGFRILNAF